MYTSVPVSQEKETKVNIKDRKKWKYAVDQNINEGLVCNL